MSISYGGDNITFPDASTQNTSPKTGFVNRIINGAMTIDQRNAGASVTPSVVAQYTVDRFISVCTQTSKMTYQQVTDAPAGFINSLKMTVSSAATPSASDQFRFCQPIEGFNVADLGWGTANAQAVTVSFKAKASIAGTYSVALWNGANGRSYVTTVSLTTAWAAHSFTVAGDTTGTWATNNTTGIELIFDLGGGSDWTTSTTNTWQGANRFKASGSVSLVSNASATLNITGVQLEKGSTATPFEFRSYGQELALCQRYYQSYPGVGQGNKALWSSYGATYNYVSWTFKTTMRTSPTVAGATTGTVETASPDAVTAYSAGSVYAAFGYNGTSFGQATASAEL